MNNDGNVAPIIHTEHFFTSFPCLDAAIIAETQILSIHF